MHIDAHGLSGTPVKQVFPISAPIEGSKLLAWAHKMRLQRVKCDLNNSIHRSMLPDSAFTMGLNEWMIHGDRNERRNRCARYRLIGGT